MKTCEKDFSLLDYLINLEKHHLLTHVPPEHCSPLLQAATDAEHLQILLAESQ